MDDLLTIIFKLMLGLFWAAGLFFVAKKVDLRFSASGSKLNYRNIRSVVINSIAGILCILIWQPPCPQSFIYEIYFHVHETKSRAAKHFLDTIFVQVSDQCFEAVLRWPARAKKHHFSIGFWPMFWSCFSVSLED